VLSLGLAVYVAHPKIGISPQTSSSGHEMPFLIKNDGTFALLDVSSACLLDEIRYENNVVETREVIALGRSAEVLGRDEAMTIACTGFTRDLPIERAAVTIFIEFSARFWPKHLMLQQTFEGARARSSVFHWWPSVRKARESRQTASLG
jgi:hypothetical protein